MDAVALEILAAAGCAALAIGARQRSVPPRPRPPTMSATRRLIRALPHRHRRAARSISDLADELLARHTEGSFEAFTALETQRNYLPQTISAFLSVPPGYRRERRTGRPNADDELRRQFRVLYAGLAQIAEADATAGVARMAANGAFLDERFGPVIALGPLPPAGAAQREMSDFLAAQLFKFIKR
jgi:hypothetical protein